ncbi:hypothetical protein V1478_011168 [Vespula squamosa]|uniref:Uncharacterized protein n=1 Tax=Vespula squamosa TaxID=30214 RepID=A0ABD2ADR2_VESSQ
MLMKSSNELFTYTLPQSPCDRSIERNNHRGIDSFISENSGESYLRGVCYVRTIEYNEKIFLLYRARAPRDDHFVVVVVVIVIAAAVVVATVIVQKCIGNVANRLFLKMIYPLRRRNEHVDHVMLLQESKTILQTTTATLDRRQNFQMIILLFLNLTRKQQHFDQYKTLIEKCTGRAIVDIMYNLLNAKKIDYPHTVGLPFLWYFSRLSEESQLKIIVRILD